jgi:hypothetical protein
VDELARSKGWLILASGEAYEKRYDGREFWEKVQRNGKTVDVLRRKWCSVFIFLEPNGMWVVWRASFSEGQSDPVSETTRGKHYSFERAIKDGEDFIRWKARNRK